MTDSATPSTDQRLLWVEQVHKSYGARPALRGVSFAVKRGELVALLGPNGAGKTTLMQILTGLFSPDRGEVEIFGQNLRHDPAAALAGMGVVFQQSALDLDLTVRANLLFHTDLHGMARAQALPRITDGLKDLGLIDQLNARVRSLSGGNRRKVELVRALLHRPRILLMDEATVGLDPPSRQQLLRAVRHLCDHDGVGVLWTTHLVEEVDQADRVVRLQAGRITYDGPPSPQAKHFDPDPHVVPVELAR